MHRITRGIAGFFLGLLGALPLSFAFLFAMSLVRMSSVPILGLDARGHALPDPVMAAFVFGVALAISLSMGVYGFLAFANAETLQQPHRVEHRSWTDTTQAPVRQVRTRTGRSHLPSVALQV
jgi:hypothetical protein